MVVFHPLGYHGAKWGKSTHLIADNKQELLEFADKINLPREWLDNKAPLRPHFDLNQKWAMRAEMFGAEQVTISVFAKRMMILQKNMKEELTQ